MWAIAKKELKSYFLSPIGYIYIGGFLLTCSIFFYLYILNYQSVMLSEMFGSATTVATFIIPILTMRMFAEEKRSGTEQILLTSPRSVTQIVLGKFIAAAIIVLISTLLTLMYLIILSFFGKPPIASNLVAIFGFSLLLIAYVSLGMFISSLVENQVVAAIISVAVSFIIWFMPSFAPATQPYSLVYAFWSSFINGTISPAGIVLLLSFSVLFVIFTIMVIQRRKLVK